MSADCRLTVIVSADCRTTGTTPVNNHIDLRKLNLHIISLPWSESAKQTVEGPKIPWWDVRSMIRGNFGNIILKSFISVHGMKLCVKDDCTIKMNPFSYVPALF